MPPRTRAADAAGDRVARFEVRLPRAARGGAACEPSGDDDVKVTPASSPWAGARLHIEVQLDSTRLDHDLRILRSLRHALDELARNGCLTSAAPEAAYRQAARRLPSPVHAATSAVALRAGMRIRVERGGAVIESGSPWTGTALAGVGTTVVEIIGRPDGLRFEPLQGARLVLTGLTGNQKVLPAVIPADITGRGSFAHWRLFLPDALPAFSDSPDQSKLTRSNQLVFVGASTADAVDALLGDTGTGCPPGLRCVVFIGHALPVPEIPITVRGERRFVAVGTTLGDLVAGLLDTSLLAPSELNEHFRQRLALRRVFGTTLVPVEIPFNDAGAWLDLPLVFGDVVTW
jgi:hypothetical protein